MSSYILQEPCGICASDTTICPIRYKCGHKFCMTCIYPNRHHVVLKQCPMCRTRDRTIALISSPICYLSPQDNFEQFYSDFTRKSMMRIELSELATKIGLHVVLEYSTYDSIKNSTQNVAYIGVLSSHNGLRVSLSNCHHLNKDIYQIYPTSPETRGNFMIKSGMSIYCESSLPQITNFEVHNTQQNLSQIPNFGISDVELNSHTN